ncbi:MAG: hypothetical protein JWP11_52 [Frankiales bacterium]|nr:hypothetical protein [Frankiales bacterium]
MPSVRHFLIVFDRAGGRVLREREFEDHRTALVERFKAEKLHRANAEIEVVVLTAESKDALRRTHARYFKTLRDIAAFQRAGEAAAGDSIAIVD